MGVGYQTNVLWKSSKCSELLSLLYCHRNTAFQREERGSSSSFSSCGSTSFLLPCSLSFSLHSYPPSFSSHFFQFWCHRRQKWKKALGHATHGLTQKDHKLTALSLVRTAVLLLRANAENTSVVTKKSSMWDNKNRQQLNIKNGPHFWG